MAQIRHAGRVHDSEIARSDDRDSERHFKNTNSEPPTVSTRTAESLVNLQSWAFTYKAVTLLCVIHLSASLRIDALFGRGYL